MNSEEQQFLNSLDTQLWDAADRLRSAVNPSEYMHVALGEQFKESAHLEAANRQNLAGLGYEV